jgi:type IX secretion system PorP/SprF family membrane protein
MYHTNKNINQISESSMSTKIILLILSFLFITLSFKLRAQQDPMYNQYIFNAYTINAAEAGTRNYGAVSMLYRWQWVGIEGAPNTGSFGFETSLGKGWGFGINAIDDRIGPTRNQTANVSTAYHISLTEKYRMSLGINVVLNNQRIDLNQLQNIIDVNDPLLTGSSNSGLKPNIGGGLLFYSSKSFLGLSMPRFIEYSTGSEDFVSVNQLRHLFVYSGVVTKLNEVVKFKPSVLFKLVDGAPFEFDLNGVLGFYDFFDFGINYRTGDGMGILSGFTIKQQLMINYAYEIPLTDLKYGSRQTHEIGIRYMFGKANFEKIQSPRFFN